MTEIRRKITEALLSDLDTKIVLLSGPRQAGKTTLSRSLFQKFEYLNYDSADDRKLIRSNGWSRATDLVVFDELHKQPKWKSFIKEIFDTEGVRPRLLVTGSARMETLKKGGDSLAGRHHHLRLYPFSVAELKDQIPPGVTLERMLRLGSFPEPFLADSEENARRWRRSHLDRILKEDVLELEPVRELKKMEILVDLLAERVGSTTSYASLARDLEVSPHTVKKWTEILESLYIIFAVRPFSKNMARALTKEPKFYFFDHGRVTAGEGARLENVVAFSLLKDLSLREDLLGKRAELFYVRDREKREVDFLTVIDGKPDQLIEVKTSDSALSPSLLYFRDRVKPERTVQVVQKLPREMQLSGVHIRKADAFLAELENLSETKT